MLYYQQMSIQIAIPLKLARCLGMNVKDELGSKIGTMPGVGRVTVKDGKTGGAGQRQISYTDLGTTLQRGI